MTRGRGWRLAVMIAAVVGTVLASALASGASAASAEGAASRPVRLDVRFTTVEGGTLAYAVVGPADGRPLLLLNGTGSPMSQWDPALVSALSAARPVVVFDYPGLGQSDPLARRLTFDALADVALGLVDHLGAPQVDVLGWSMGGFVAQRLAVRAPRRVHALVLAGTNPGGSRAVLGPDWVQAEDSDPDAGLREYVRTNYPVGRRDRGWAFVRRVQSAIDSGRYPPDTVPPATFDAMVAAEDPWLASDRNGRQLARLPMPALVVTGAQDVVTPPANALELARLIPDATLRLVPRAGHSFLFQAPVRTARLVGEFLTAH